MQTRHSLLGTLIAACNKAPKESFWHKVKEKIKSLEKKL